LSRAKPAQNEEDVDYPESADSQAHFLDFLLQIFFYCYQPKTAEKDI